MSRLARRVRLQPDHSGPPGGGHYTWAVLALVLMTAWLGAAPSPSSVADAAMKGDRDAVRALLKQGADVSASKGDGMTALHYAAERGDTPMTEMLVYAGANVAAVTRIGQYTPLHLASRSGNGPVVEALLKAGANVSAKTSNSGVVPLHLAAASGNAAVVTLLLDHGADADAKESEWGQTPLMFAAAGNRAEAVRVLLSRGADATIATKTIDLAHQSQLDRAANNVQRKVLEASVSKGQQPTASQVQAAIQASRELYSSGKIPPPEPAAAGGRGGRGGRGGAAGDPADPDAANAANSFNPEEINPLVSSKGGLTALLHASRQGHLDAARALLEYGAPIDQVGAGDATSPLLMAVINGEFDLAMLLIERGANTNLAAAGNGAAPLWAAVNALSAAAGNGAAEGNVPRRDEGAARQGCGS